MSIEMKLPRPLRLFTRASVLASVLAVGCLSGCGGAAEAPPAPVNIAQVLDSDPLALLPAGPAVLAVLDARAFYASGSTGAQVASLAEGFLPLGQEVGFSAGRDVDRIYAAVYVGAGMEGLTVLSGRFDVAKIQAAGAAHIPTRAGVPLVGLPYAGRTIFTISAFAFAPVTDRTMVAGSESAVRRALDRLAVAGPQAAPRREVADWMLATVQAPGSSYALAADVAAIPPAAFRGLPLPPGMTGLLRVNLLGDFNPPGLNVGGTLSYADPTRAEAGANNLKQLAAFVNVASSLGAAPRVQNLNIATNGLDTTCRFSLDEEAMRRTLGSVLKALGVPSPAAGPAAYPGAYPPAYPPMR